MPDTAKVLFRWLSFGLFSILPLVSAQGQGAGLDGRWSIVPSKSTGQATWGHSEMQLDLRHDSTRMSVLHQWIQRRRIALVDSFSFVPGGGNTTIPVTSPVWTGNWYMGVLTKPDSKITVSGDWKRRDSSLTVTAEQPVLVSQGEVSVKSTWEYTLHADTLTVIERRSTRPTPVVLTFARKVALEGWPK